MEAPVSSLSGRFETIESCEFNSSLISTTRVAERCGFSREGVLRAWEPVKDEQPDVVMWSRSVNDPAPDLGHA